MTSPHGELVTHERASERGTSAQVKLKWLGLALSHAIAGAVVVGGAVILAVVLYAGLLLWAIATDAPLGGPLALLFLVLAGLVASVLAIVLVLLPATALSRAVCRRVLGWPLVGEIPLAVVFSFALVTGIASAAALARGVAPADIFLKAQLVGVLLLVPLGVYWWILQACSGAAVAGGWMVRRVVELRRRAGAK